MDWAKDPLHRKENHGRTLTALSSWSVYALRQHGGPQGVEPAEATGPPHPARSFCSCRPKWRVPITAAQQT